MVGRAMNKGVTVTGVMASGVEAGRATHLSRPHPHARKGGGHGT